MPFELILTFLLSLVLIRFVRHYAPKFDLVDVPNERSMHSDYTPRGAGIGIYLAAASVVLIFHYELVWDYLWIYLAILLVFIIGVLDDHRDASHNAKFFVIIIGTILLCCDDLVIRDLGTYFGMQISLGWLAIPFTVFAVVGFTNALNLIDGLDGLAALISIVVLSALFAIGYQYDDQLMIVTSGAFIAALLAFLIFNWHPASIFMGDSGSLTIGFVISLLAVRSLEYIPAVAIFFLAGIPIIDTLVVMVRRKMQGTSMFYADKCHMHHVFLGFFEKSIPKTVFLLALMQLIYTLTSFQIEAGDDLGIPLLLFALNVVLYYFFLGAMIKRQKLPCLGKKDTSA